MRIAHYLSAAEITQCMTAKYGVCEYDDAKHEYKVGGVVVQSITQKKKEVVPEFNGEEIALKMQQRTGIPAEQYLEEWKAVADCGTMVHELLEALLMGGKIQRPTDHSQYSKIAHERFLSYRKMGIVAMMLKAFHEQGLIPVACEFRVWTDKYAGTLDVLAFDPLINLYRVPDWKTNSKAFRETPYDKPLAAPFQDYSSSHLDQYSIQLESYAAILEAVGVPCGPGLILHGYWDSFDAYCDVLKTKQEMRHICRKWLNILQP